MTKKGTNIDTDIADKNFKKLSIQVSLNGLSFCVADTVSQEILYSDSVTFAQKKHPSALLHELQKLFDKHGITNNPFDEVVVVHRNALFALVPATLFQPDQLEAYLKLNIKILQNDVLAYDELKNQEIVNVYVPFMNINNYIYELYGEFVFLHNGTVLIETLLNKYGNQKETLCYGHVSKNQLDFLVMRQKELLFYNSFPYNTKEDFAYYLLFVLEQMELDPETVAVKLFGDIEEDDSIFALCHTYIRHISIFAPSPSESLKFGVPETASIDFTVLNTL
jgi:hypothetical protein